MKELQKYFKAKIGELGRKLDLNQTLLLQGLNDGFPAK